MSNNIDIKSFDQGYYLLTEEVIKNAKVGFYSSDPEIKPIPVENFQLSDEEMEFIKETIAEETSLKTKSLLGNFSSDIQFLFYEIATSFYYNADLEKSINCFIFLTTINPYVPAFWIGLGLAYERNLDHYKAIDAFKVAITVSPDDFTPYCGLIRCFETIKDYVAIKEILEAAKDNEAIKSQVLEAQDYLKTKN